MNTFVKHKEIHKFTWEARGRKWFIDVFVTNLKTWKVIEDVGIYRSIEGSGYYLLCAKVHFPPQWINKKKVSVEQEEFFKTRLLMIKTYDGCTHKA
jgi:hypothetical protein